MSKGLGKQQRRILDELQQRPAFHLDELATTRSERVSLNRAAWKLSDAGRISLTRFHLGHEKIFITRPGATVDRVKYIRDRWQEMHDKANNILSVEQVTR